MAVVCLLLVALLSVVQVTHFHTNQNDAYHCALCITMHTVVPAAVLVTAIVMVRMGSSKPVFKTRSLVRYWHPSLFTRPPPANV